MKSLKQSGSPARRFWTPLRVSFTGLVCALIAVAASSASCNNQPANVANESGNRNGAMTASGSVTITSSRPGDGNPPPAPAPLTPLPAEVSGAEIASLNGESFRLQDYRGRVLVLDLWATWCGPCRLEIPHLIEIGNEYRERGVEVVGLTTENQQADEAKVRAFAREFNINYQLGWAERPLALGLMRGNFSIPQTFIITRDGRILHRFVGFSPTLPARMRQKIEEALNMPAS